MTRWEYKTGYCVDGGDVGNEEYLNKLGGEGWELVQVFCTRATSDWDFDSFTFFFKRPMPEGGVAA